MLTIVLFVLSVYGAWMIVSEIHRASVALRAPDSAINEQGRVMLRAVGMRVCVLVIVAVALRVMGVI